jgi:hypothetical protein
VTILVERQRAAVRAHPNAVPLLLARRHDSPAALRWTEAMLGALRRAGFTGARRVIAQRTVVSYLLGALQTEHFSALSGAGTAAMAELPVEDYPLLTQTARDARRVSADEEFRQGLAAVLRGLATDGTRQG